MNNKQMLQSILGLLQWDQCFLRRILSTAMTPTLRDVLEGLLAECKGMESDAASIAASRDWIPEGLQPGQLLLYTVIYKISLFRLRDDSRLAAAVIQHSTKTMIRLLTVRHRMTASDSRVLNLSQRYLDCQTAALHKLQGFL